ncbi:MAG: dTMP kinase [Gammaproteobacteria bacterium]
MRGKFITIEGTEGVGKTTNMAYVQAQLEAAGKTVVVTREPGGTAIGEKIRDLLLDARHQDLVDDTELLLMFAARAQHIHQVIEPALKAGKWVLCDRFTDATYAYQGGGRGIDSTRIAMLEAWVQGALRPDLILLLDIAVQTGLTRAGQRSTPDRFEREAHSFFERVRNAYRARADNDPKHYRIIDAAQPLNVVQIHIRQALSDMLAL